MSESEAAAGSVPAGWYSDPAGTTDLRWWDGLRWTTQLQAPPAPVEPAPVMPAPTAEKAYVPFSSAAAAPRPTLRGIAYTRTVWWICFQPLWGLATQFILYAIVTAFGPVPSGLLILGFTVLN